MVLSLQSDCSVYLLSVYFTAIIRTGDQKCPTRCPHPAAAAVPVLAETGGTGQATGEDDPASKPAAGAATAAGCPATKTNKQGRKVN